jgi:hypothetical protein
MRDRRRQRNARTTWTSASRSCSANDIDERLRTGSRRRDQVSELDGRRDAFRGLYIASACRGAHPGTFGKPIAISPLPRGASFALVIS